MHALQPLQGITAEIIHKSDVLTNALGGIKQGSAQMAIQVQAIQLCGF
jgi:hypothetical protein